MRKSQIAALSALTVVVLIMVAAIVAARVIVEQLGSDEYRTDARAPARSADIASEDLRLSGFTRIDARGSWEVSITQGQDWSVKLDYPDDIEDQLRVRTEGDRLVLSYERPNAGWWRGFGGGDRGRGVRAEIVMPALESVDIAGASEFMLSGFSGEKLSITASGAVDLNGRDSRFDELILIVSGAGDVNFGEVVVDDAQVVLSGAADVTLNMNGGRLSGTLSGAGKVRYRGSVSAQSIVASGFTSVEALR
jgi:hypothetical protein